VKDRIKIHKIGNPGSVTPIFAGCFRNDAVLVVSQWQHRAWNVHASGVRRKFSWGGFYQWHMVVICICCSLFV